MWLRLARDFLTGFSMTRFAKHEPPVDARQKHSRYRKPADTPLAVSDTRGGVQAEQASVNVMPTFERW